MITETGQLAFGSKLTELGEIVTSAATSRGRILIDSISDLNLVQLSDFIQMRDPFCYEEETLAQ